MGQYPRRGKTPIENGGGDRIAFVLCALGLVAGICYFAWIWSSWLDLFTPDISWLPWPL